MNKKGFTLVELLGVIVLIGLIAAIVYPNIKKLIQEQKTKLYNKQVSLIEQTAYDWTVDNTDIITTNGDYYYLQLNELVKDGYIKEKDIVDPRDNSIMTGHVSITWNGDKFLCEYKTYMNE